MSENGEIYTASKNFTLLPALTALTNFNSALQSMVEVHCTALYSTALQSHHNLEEISESFYSCLQTIMLIVK